MGSNGHITIKKDYLEQLIKFSSNKLVGKIAKRFEIHDNHAVLKAEVKELLYEGIRDFRDLLLAAGMGLEITEINFKKDKEKVHST